MSRRTKGAPKKRTVPPTDEEEEEEGNNNGNEQQQKTPPKRVAKRKTVCPGALTVSTSPSTLVLCGVQQSKYGTCFWRTPNSTGAAPTGATISAVCCRTCGQVDHTMECCLSNRTICFNCQQPGDAKSLPIQKVHRGQCGRVPTANGQQTATRLCYNSAAAQNPLPTLHQTWRTRL